MFIDQPEYAAYLTQEAKLYDRILGVYAVTGSDEYGAWLYEEFMTNGDFTKLSQMPKREAFLIQTMWRVHLLHPLTYLRDCLRCYGELVLPQYMLTGPLLPIMRKDDIKITTHTLCKVTPTPDIRKRFCSMNLVDGMKRQLEFMSKISNLDGFRDARYCKESIKRYKKFLKLIGMRKGIIVPTLDIDLVWHTHMLFPGHYNNDTKKVIGFTPDHDDDMPNQRLELRREKTQALWNATYKDERYNTKNNRTKSSGRNRYMLVFSLLLSSLLLYGSVLKNGDGPGSTAFPTLAQTTATWLVPLIIGILILGVVICICCRRKELGGQWKSYTVTIANSPLSEETEFPITFEKDSDNKFKVLSLTMARTSYVSTAGDIRADDII